MAQTNYGGLQSFRSPAITIVSEDINLSLDQVKVTYVYLNTSNNDLTETLVLTDAPSTILVNQRPAQLQTMQQSLSASGREISKELKSLGLPLNPVAAMHTIDASPNRTSIIARLRAQNLIDKREDTPTWVLHTYYYWHQVFPANSKVIIEQTYKPAVTTESVKLNSFATLLKLPAKMVKKVWNVAVHWTLEDDAAQVNLQEQFEKYFPRISKYCPSKKDFQILVNSYKQKPNRKPKIEVKEISFANNNNESWANSINHFNLTIECPKNMHALLCWNDELKRNNNLVQYSAENYVPLPSIKVLYIEK